jgi:hypothetical protein
MTRIFANRKLPHSTDRFAASAFDTWKSNRQPVLQLAFPVLLAAVTLTGLWVSYHQARWQWHLEGDIAQPYLFPDYAQASANFRSR